MSDIPHRTTFPENHYYVPEESWTDNAYTVVRAGKALTSADHFIQRDVYPGQDIMVCTSGKGFVLTEGKTWSIAENQIVWIANELPHAHWPDKSDPWTLLFLRLDGPNCIAMRRKIFGTGSTVTTLSSLIDVETLFSKLFEILRRRPHDIDLALNHLVSELMHSIATPLARFEKSRLPNALTTLIDKMRRDPQRSWHAEELSAVSGLSAAQTRRLFQNHLRISPRRWLIRERVMMAQQMLLESDLTIGEIAEHCGFYDAYHFSREFKRSTGTSPRNWRSGEGGAL